MSLIVEDGTGRADAESYASAADADTYLANRGIASWASGDTPTKEACLRKATAYLHNFTWKGQRVNADQALDWPRAWVQVDNFYFNHDAIPNDVKHACIELAYRASKGELQADLGQQVTSVTVGPISKTFAAGSTASKQYQSVVTLISRFIQGGGSSVSIVRM